jgi:hypothetical protein
LRQVMI